MNKEKLIWGLEELCDRDMQERVWLGKSEGEMSSFVEAVCLTFDDSGLGIVLDGGREDANISAELRERAIQLDRLIKTIPQTLTPANIINHPTMQKVRDLAEEMLAILKAS